MYSIHSTEDRFGGHCAVRLSPITEAITFHMHTEYEAIFMAAQYVLDTKE